MQETLGIRGMLGRQALAWVLGSVLILGFLVAGFLGGESLVLGAAAVAGFLGLLGFFLVPISVPIKLVFFLVTVSFLQRSLGYFKLEGIRGLNVGNLLVAAAAGYWVLNALRTGRWYRKTPVDFWLFLTVFVIPPFSIAYTVAFGDIRGYTFGLQLAWYKQWFTPFLYFFLLSQCLESRRDVRMLVYLLCFLVAVGILDNLPSTLAFSSWHDSRSEGFIQEANQYAALLATSAPFMLLIVFLLRERRVLRMGMFALLGGVGITLLTTYSRSGYIGFAFALMGSLYVAYRCTRKFPVGLPALIAVGAFFLPVALAPQTVDYVKERFTMKTYQRAKRKSYGAYSVMNQFAGDRLEIWTGAVKMAQERPIFGMGFHSFELQLPKYHRLGTANYPHNQYLGTLAEGGVIWLAALVLLYWRLFLVLYQNWKMTLAENDTWGQVVTGGSLVCFLVMQWISLTLDFNHPGPKTTLFWVMMAGAVKYGLLPPDPEPERGTEALVPVPVREAVPQTTT